MVHFKNCYWIIEIFLGNFKFDGFFLLPITIHNFSHLFPDLFS